MRFHLLGIPHTATNKDFLPCAYTQKVLKLAKMLTGLGHEVIHYGNETSQVDCEHVTVTTMSDIVDCYGNEEWRTQFFKFDVNDAVYRTFYANTIAAIQQRKRPQDFLLCMWGHGHRAVAEFHSDMIVVEPGIGYGSGHFAPYKVFESYALLHAYLGLEKVQNACQMNTYEVVIPNYFDPDDFQFGTKKDDYVLSLGRVTSGKGVHVVMQMAERLPHQRFIVAGQGSLAEIGYPDGLPNVDFVGSVGVDGRRNLLTKAKAVIMPSQYVEPFGGVQVEAMFSGTPVISSDWGAFTEINLHGVTGFRCRTMDQYLWAIQNISDIDLHACRKWAMDNFAMDRCARMYDEFFRMVMDVYTTGGWYTENPHRSELDWLSRYFSPKEGVKRAA